MPQKSGHWGFASLSRQIVQNVEVGRLYDVSAQPTAVQWGPMAMFLAAFLAGAAVIGWIIAQILKAPPEPTA